MSASQYEPEALQVIDLGQAPEILVDGVAAQVDLNGIVRTVFFTLQVDPSSGNAIRVVSLRLNCTAEAYRQIERQQAATNPTAASRQPAPH